MADIEVRLNPDVPPTGSDLGFVNAARRSFNTRSEWDYVGGYRPEHEQRVLKDKDKRLLEFLARGMTAKDFEEFLLVFDDRQLEGKGGKEVVKEKLWEWRNTPTHDTPFNHGFISFEVKAPIFVRAQLVKHEYLIMSEFSRRYITDGIEFYEPDYWRKAAENKKQGSLEEPLEHGDYSDVQEYTNESLYDISKMCERYFEDFIALGVPAEQARMVLPQSTMTEWTWSGTPGAFYKMCQLRCHPEAQYEARIVANKVYDLLAEQWPVSTPLMVKGVY